MSKVKVKQAKNDKKESNVYIVTSVYSSEEKKTAKDLIKELLTSKSKYVS